MATRTSPFHPAPLVTLLVLTLGAALPLAAQAPGDTAAACTERRAVSAAAGVYDDARDAARVARITGRGSSAAGVLRRPSSRREPAACKAGPAHAWIASPRGTAASSPGGLRLRTLPIQVLTQLNTTYPTHGNDGPLWAGRGWNTAVSGGFRVTWGAFSLGTQPVAAYHQNRDFPTADLRRTGYSPFIHSGAGTAIDQPQRFGVDPFWTLHPGQSYIRLDLFGAAIGFSTENLWWGPAQRYPVLMSNTAPGFPHVFVGTSRPADIGIGTVDVELLWGHLAESEYFDADPANNRRLFAGTVVEFRPEPTPNLTLGAARSFLATIPPRGFALSDYIGRPFGDVLSNPLGRSNPLANNQLISLFARWVFPESGFEVYGEWAREDHWEDLQDLLGEFDHSQGVMLGLQRSVRIGDDRWLRIRGELVDVAKGATVRSGRNFWGFYMHSQIRQGYTHRGQVLGASVGPGSDAQFVGADVFTRWGRVGAYLERVRHDNDVYYDRWARYYGYTGHDVELTAGTEYVVFFGSTALFGGTSFSYRWNRNFLGHPSLEGEGRTDRNWRFRLGLRWDPGSLLATPAEPVSVTDETSTR